MAEEDEASSNDEQDEFYDRTKKTKTMKEKQNAPLVVHDAASLLGRKVSHQNSALIYPVLLTLLLETSA